MKIAPGSRIAIEIEPLEHGRCRVVQRLRVGHTGAKDMGAPKICSSEADAWAAIELLAQEQLARIGLDVVRRRQ